MDDDTLRAPAKAAEDRKRLDLLLQGERRAGGGARYTRFVRAMRLVLPLIAVGIVGLLVSWPRVEERMAPPPEAASAPAPETVGQNELINPRFESEDQKSQPFTITAARAVQSSDNPDIVFLEKPVGDINLADGSWVAAEAGRGAFNQRAERLILEESVRLFHDKGYEIVTERLLIDMAARIAWSDAAVKGQGPAGTLAASGVRAEAGTGTVIFTGPAKLVLNRSVRGL